MKKRIVIIIVMGLVLMGCPFSFNFLNIVDGGNEEEYDYHNNNHLKSVTANGSTMSSTSTQLTLTFNKDIDGLTASDISLASVTANVRNTGTPTDITKGSLTRIGTGVYALGISGITVSGTVDVTVSKAGVEITDNVKRVMVHRFNTVNDYIVCVNSNNQIITCPGPLFSKTLDTMGVWLWYDNTTTNLAIDNIYSRLKFCELNGVTEIYYQIGNDGVQYDIISSTTSNSTRQRLQTVISAAKKYGIKVYVALNKGQYINEGNSNTAPASLPFTTFTTFMNSFLAYQNSVTEDQKFAGIHLDLEWEEPWSGIATKDQFMAFLVHVNDTYRKPGLIEDLSACACYWWTTNSYNVTHRGTSNVTMMKAMAAELDRIMLMAYTNIVSGGSQVRSSIENMLAPWYNNRGNSKIICAAETGTQESNYWGNYSKAEMYDALSKVASSNSFSPLLSDSTSGMAIDDIGTWMRLK